MGYSKTNPNRRISIKIGPENDLANFLSVHLTNPYLVNMAEPQQTRRHSPPGRRKSQDFWYLPRADWCEPYRCESRNMLFISRYKIYKESAILSCFFSLARPEKCLYGSNWDPKPEREGSPGAILKQDEVILWRLRPQNSKWILRLTLSLTQGGVILNKVSPLLWTRVRCCTVVISF